MRTVLTHRLAGRRQTNTLLLRRSRPQNERRIITFRVEEKTGDPHHTDGRICLANNTAERDLRGIALDRKAWLFAGFKRGGERAAIMKMLIQSAKLNDVDPHASLAERSCRIANHPARCKLRCVTLKVLMNSCAWFCMKEIFLSSSGRMRLSLGYASRDWQTL